MFLESTIVTKKFQIEDSDLDTKDSDSDAHDSVLVLDSEGVDLTFYTGLKPPSRNSHILTSEGETLNNCPGLEESFTSMRL